MGKYDDILNAFAQTSGGRDDDDNPLAKASHPITVETLRRILEDRNAFKSDLIEKFDGDEDKAAQWNNPQGIQCGLVDAIIAVYSLSPFAFVALMMDRMSGGVTPGDGDPGRFLHEMGHLLFDMGRGYERLQISEQIERDGIKAESVAKSWEAEEESSSEEESKDDSPFSGFLRTLKFGNDEDN